MIMKVVVLIDFTSSIRLSTMYENEYTYFRREKYN